MDKSILTLKLPRLEARNIFKFRVGEEKKKYQCADEIRKAF